MNEHPVKVSVALITYNHEPYIRKALDSVLMQITDFPFDIVIGEDCSTDGTRKIVEDYKKKYPDKIKIVTSETNVGPMPNVVRTYKACSGKYIAMLEGDDFWTNENKLQDQVALMELNQNFSMCFTNGNVVDVNDSVIRHERVPPVFRKTLTFKEIMSGFTPPTQTILFRKDLLDDNIMKNLEKVYNGDIFISVVLSTKGEIGYINRIAAAYRINEDGIYGKASYYKRLKNQLNTYRVLLPLISKKYHKYLLYAQTIVKQRLFVISIINGNILYHFKTAFWILLHDIRYFDYSLLRATKLLFVKIYNPSKEITD